MSETKKCACEMTAMEILQQNLEVTRPSRSILIVDLGNGWDVTMFGPEMAGNPLSEPGPDHVTIQATIEAVERMLVNLRRQSESGDPPDGEIITDPDQIVQALSESLKGPTHG